MLVLRRLWSGIFVALAACSASVAPDGGMPPTDAAPEAHAIADVAAPSDAAVPSDASCTTASECGPGQVCVHQEGLRVGPQGTCADLPSSCGATPSCDCPDLPGCHTPTTACTTCRVSGRDVYCACLCC